MSRRSVRRLFMAAGVTTLALLSVAQGGTPPVNDDCEGAIALSLNTPVAGTTAGATTSFPTTTETCTSDTPEVWYTFTTPEPGVYRFTVTGSDNSALSLAALGIFGCDPSFYSVNGCDQGSSGQGPVVDVSSLFGSGELISLRVGSSVDQTFTITASVTPPPVNDECAGAIPLSLNVPYSGNSATATDTLVVNDANACSSLADGFDTGADVFFAFTPSTTGFYDIGACGTEFDSVLSVHSGCPVSTGNMITCNDSGSQAGCGDPFDTFSAYITGAPMNGGQTYYIRLAGAKTPDFTGRGNYNIYVIEGVETPVPANDLCEDAEVITADSFFGGSTVNATIGTASSCGFDDVFDVWYSFTSNASSTTNYKFTILSGSFGGQATLSVYDACGSEQSCVSYSAFTVPMSAGFTVGIDPGQTVLIRIAANGGGQDAFVLQTQTAGVAGPGTACENPLPLTAGSTVTVDNSDAATSAPSSCTGFPDIYPKWYTFTSSTAGYYRFETGPTEGNRPTITLYDSCGGPERICSILGDTLVTDPSQTAVSLYLNAGETVIVRTALDGSGQGTYDLTATGPLPPPPAVSNDTCATAEAVGATPFNDVTDITLADDDQDICVSPFGDPEPAYSGIWYTFTPSSNTYLVASATCSDDQRSGRIVVFSGSCGSLTQVACPDLFGPGGAPPIALTGGTTYHILASVGQDKSGNITPVRYATTLAVHLETVNPPANDHCSGAQAIESSSANLSFTNIVADADTASASCGGFGSSRNNGVWFKFKTGAAGTLTLHGEHPFDGGGNPNYSPLGVVYTGSCGSLSEVACDNPTDGFFITNHFDITTGLNANTTYYVLVAAYGSPGGGDTDLTFNYTGTIVPACGADFNGVNGVTVQDIFDFLTAWLAGNSSADFNHVNGVTVQDIFDFLTAWLAGC